MAKRQDASTGQIVDDNKKSPKEGDIFHLKVYAPFKNYFEGEVDSVSAANDTGPFDILAGHHNFITLLNPCDLVIRSAGKDDEIIKITRGIMQVKADDVVVFLDV
ncbi:MAG: F0F1 ATP synthase subunit epsilon [Candidatus Saccharimonadales bacterium]